MQKLIHFWDKYEEAAADLNSWQVTNCLSSYVDDDGMTHTLQTLTRESINEFWSDLKYCPIPSMADGGSDRTIKKELHPQGFTVASGEQENFIQCVLHMRRIETMHDGQRWCDIKTLWHRSSTQPLWTGYRYIESR